MTDSGQILGPLVMGFFADAVDLSTPFMFGAVLLMATAWQPPSQRHVARRHRERTRLMTSANGRVMVVAAHPDDPEFLAGGTVARLAKEGREITYVIVTNGNKGSSDRGMTSEQLGPIRAEEQRRAARVLRVERVEFLGCEDGEVEDTRNLRRDITREIRRWRPELIITLNPHRTYT